MDLIRLEKELKNRLQYGYNWGKKQDNSWDQQTNFIYKTYSVQKLIERTQQLNTGLKNYALNRWYNYWSAMAVEDIFCSHPNVIANKNVYDKLVDFRINNIPFDHKTSIFPKGFNKDIDYALNNKRELIQWLYDNQSQQGRKHLENRLFIVLYDSNNEHWKMKAEISILKHSIDDYICKFNEMYLETFDFGNGKVLSDILWIRR
jgi:hypothetical protein